jgi:hypothetical protein
MLNKEIRTPAEFIITPANAKRIKKVLAEKNLSISKYIETMTACIVVGDGD